MTDIATLGIKIESRSAVDARRNLDQMTPAAKRATVANTALSGSAAKVAGTMPAAAKSTAAATAATNALAAASARANGAMGLLAARAAAVPLIGGASALLAGRKFITNSIEQERVVAQLESAIRSTGGAAGFVAHELTDMASGLQKVTTYGDEAIIGAQGVLLTFTKIGREIFPEAQSAILDVATAMRMDLQSATLQVGKALNDPILGMTALTRSGIQFTKSQKDQIKTLVESGRTIDAQRILLAELETQFGGSARAARQTLGGALASLENSFGDLFEVGSEGSAGLTKSINGLTDILSDPGTIRAAQGFGAVLFDSFAGAATLMRNMVDNAGNLADLTSRAAAAGGKSGFGVDFGIAGFRVGAGPQKYDPLSSISAGGSSPLELTVNKAAPTLPPILDPDKISALDAAWQKAISGAERYKNALTDPLDEYAVDAFNVAGGIGGAFVDAFQGAEDALAKFVMTGKADFGDLAQSILADLIRIQIRSSITGPLATAIGGAFGGGGGINAGLYHTGRGPGEINATRFVHAAHFDDAPRFHSGIGPGEQAAVIRKDESVLTPGQMRALGAQRGGGPVAVHIHNAPAGVTAESKQSQEAGGGVRIDVMLKGAVSTMIADGSLDTMMGRTYGLQRRGR
ncbi:phage tail tape measure C-terminal domain-containing protein [Bauldia litoralis]|uniref:phage tail tape measure C-terminal domain-containing protein n=1 Tax=Bauldia litoralis TaxID=665467 RepID=UPI003265040E